MTACSAREDECPPVLFHQNIIILLVKTKENPTWEFDLDQLFERIQNMSCLWMVHPICMCWLYVMCWLCTERGDFSACTQWSQKIVTKDFFRQIFQRKQTSHILLQITEVHLFRANLLKAMVSLNSWHRTWILMQGGGKMLYISPLLKIFVTQLHQIDVLADFWSLF